MKGLKYEKKRLMSNSPIRHMAPSTARRPISPPDVRDMPPYELGRYQSSSAVHHPSQYSSPTRKKPRREPDNYYSRSMSASPPPRHTVVSPERNISPRPAASPPAVHHRQRRNIPVGHVEREKNYGMRPKHHESPPMDRPTSRLKEAPVKVPYPTESSRYRSVSPDNRYAPSGSKSYGPTLHERFSSVIISNRAEPRVHYSREDLEKITIDIRRNPRDPSPPPPMRHHIVNPSEIKLIRRANEGRRPIFDREEIKQASRDMREDPYYERKTGDSYQSAHPPAVREMENYQITRHRFDDHREALVGSGRPLNDRFPTHSGRKEVDERDKGYQKIPVARIPVRSYVSSRSRSRSGDRDFRSDRYLDVKAPSSSRSDYQRIPVNPPESRNSITYTHRKNSMPLDARHKLNVKRVERDNLSAIRPEPKSHYLPDNRHYSDNLPPPRVERRDHSPVPEPHKWEYKSRSPSREKYSEYPRRPEKYGYKPWIDKPDIPPKSPDYFVPESRELPSPYMSRGTSRPFRSTRGFRTRGFRGPMRGNSYYRSSYRGYQSSTSPRGRGMLRR